MLDTGDIISRAAAAKALGLLKDPRAIPALITVLERFTGLSQTVPAEAELQAITGQNFGTDVLLWRTWWKHNKKIVRVKIIGCLVLPADRARAAYL